METEESVIIRKAIHEPYGTNGDYAHIARFQMACCMETEGRTLASEKVTAGVVHILQHEKLGQYFIAEHTNKDGVKTVAGCCLIQLQFSDWNCANYICLESVYIAPEFRRKGILQTLFEHVEKHARQHWAYGGLGEIRANVSRLNLSMQKAMEKLGCKETVYKVYSKEL
jgi:GNAT superfamily N-acetyltransferase